MPQMVNGARNFRWNYIRSGYLICLTRDGKDDWFLLSTPKRSHKGLSVTAAITCQHICAQLNKKNLYLAFDDENGIGTAEYLLRQVLENTGWQLGYCETFYEQDGKTEKVRSLSSDGKRGAYLLICKRIIYCKVKVALAGAQQQKKRTGRGGQRNHHNGAKGYLQP